MVIINLLKIILSINQNSFRNKKIMKIHDMIYAIFKLLIAPSFFRNKNKKKI